MEIINGIEHDTADIMNVTQLRKTKGADMASAAALAPGSDGNYFDVTGTTAITSINTVSVGTIIHLHFDGALTFTHNATDLILPGAANITTAAGDEAIMFEYASGDWRCLNYTKADGSTVSLASPGAIGGTTPAAGTFTDLQGHLPDIVSAGDISLSVAQCRGQIVYITQTGTATLPAVTGDGMLVGIYSTTAAAIYVDPNGSDRIVLNGTAGGDGKKLTSESQAGDFIWLHNDDTSGWRTIGRSGIWTMEA